MKSTSAVISGQSLNEYFMHRLSRSTSALKPEPNDDTLAYLAAMLTRLAHAEDLFSYHEGRLTLQPLALLYRDALEAPSQQLRCLMFRQLGDQSLFIGALFPELYKRMGIHQDYFIGMGGGAYQYLADQGASHHQVYQYLSRHFSPVLNSVAQACHKEICFDAQDVFALYQKWLATGDRACRQQLEAMGITLSATPQGRHMMN